MYFEHAIFVCTIQDEYIRFSPILDQMSQCILFDHTCSNFKYSEYVYLCTNTSPYCHMLILNDS